MDRDVTFVPFGSLINKGPWDVVNTKAMIFEKVLKYVCSLANRPPQLYRFVTSVAKRLGANELDCVILRYCLRV
jgi:hypothetical protein